MASQGHLVHVTQPFKLSMPLKVEHDRGTPNPRKLKEVPIEIRVPNPMESTTLLIIPTFGRICRRMVRKLLPAKAYAASVQASPLSPTASHTAPR